jgi:purine-binding chemotaxis protein CheW
VKVALFKMGNEVYAISVENVISIERLQPVTKIVMEPSYIVGITDIRGNITTVINLQEMISLKNDSKNRENYRVIVINHKNKYIGLMVEEVTDVLDIAEESIQNIHNDSIFTNSLFTRVIKMNNCLVILMDLEKLLVGVTLPESFEDVV